MSFPIIDIIILGCGPSTGVPVAGQAQPYWGACDAKNPFNNRTRSSVYICTQGRGTLVDTTPDLRHHMLTHGLTELEHVIITHDHADHLHGIDDLRPVFFKRQHPLSLMADAMTLEKIQKRFGYLLKNSQEDKNHSDNRAADNCSSNNSPSHGLYPKIFNATLLKSVWEWQGLSCQSFQQNHGKSFSQGLRFGPVAYSTDFVDLDDTALKSLENLDLWIVDCIGRTPKATHCHLDRTLMFIDKVKPKAAILTHMGPELDYETLLKELPAHVRPAYDGLKIRLEEGRLTLLS